MASPAPWRVGLPRLPGGAEDRFPGFDVLDQLDNWDEVTAGVVLARLAPPAPLQFFTPTEERTGRALVDRLLAQDEEPRVPVLDMIDARLAAGQTDGWHYDSLPPDADAWRTSLVALDDDARAHADSGFGELDMATQKSVLEAIRTNENDWHGLAANRIWSMWMRYACAAFYSHPWAWNEIGFGGPAYPRGYKNAGLDRREPWEVAEHGADAMAWEARLEAARQRQG
ncbi:MAG: gluconate 2-dehydrogenase subunit 3 family protein [Acidimicrobiia bacterium]|nr:gluconate 2-dehydrogenase subunit 3 family protein [Acidimicrobiia bacterium]